MQGRKYVEEKDIEIQTKIQIVLIRCCSHASTDVIMRIVMKFLAIETGDIEDA